MPDPILPFGQIGSQLPFGRCGLGKLGLWRAFGVANPRPGRFDEGQMWDWLDEFFGWVRVVLAIAGGPVILILSLVNGLWGYAIFGALFTIFGAFVAKWVFWKEFEEGRNVGNRDNRAGGVGREALQLIGPYRAHLWWFKVRPNGTITVPTPTQVKRPTKEAKE